MDHAMTHAERERLFLNLFRENKSRILRLCPAYLNSTAEAEELRAWLRDKRVEAERRPLIAQLTAMERALKALKEGPL
ncbi:MAG TPA: hypothetical protein VKJ01_05400 [Candidatus Solibacter sp.]|jgi:hypothetical protein|nr:hypothetical protein [Candidatus Solibacter sp.]